MISTIAITIYFSLLLYWCHFDLQIRIIVAANAVRTKILQWVTRQGALHSYLLFKMDVQKKRDWWAKPLFLCMIFRASESLVSATYNLFDSNGQEIVAPYLHTPTHVSLRYINMSGVFSFIVDPWSRKWKGKTTLMPQNATNSFPENCTLQNVLPVHDSVDHRRSTSQKNTPDYMIRRMSICIGVSECWALIPPRFYRVLTMVYNTRNYWVFGLCPSSGF
jgi:hypothetical protein